MTPLQNLHYAIGQLAYAIACADGKIQQEERRRFLDIVAAELKHEDYDFNISDIIFQVLDHDKYASAEVAYDWAMKEIRLNSHYLSPKLKASFLRVIEKVAEAYMPITKEEVSIIKKFKKDIEPLNGDPVYYDNHKPLKN